MSGGVWQRTLIYLGLREEPEAGYDELPERFVPEDDPHAEHAPRRPTPLAGEQAPANVRPLRGDRPIRVVGAPFTRTAVVQIYTFDDVEDVGSRYRTGQPVVFDAGSTTPDTARRVVDFVSGLIYASHGTLSKVGRRAFLLVPDGVELPGDERERLGDLGYDLATEGNA